MKKTLLLLLVALFAMAPAALAADLTGTLTTDLTGRFDAGTKYEEPALHAPANVSRMFVRTVARSESVDLPAVGGSSMIIWTIPARDSGSPVVTRLRAPNGAVLQPRDRGSIERGLRRFQIEPGETAEMGFAKGAQEVVHVMSTMAASYHLDVEMPAGVPGVTVIAAEPDSAIALFTWAAPLSRQPGQPVTLHAELREGSAPIAGAHVTARLASPSGRAFAALELTEQADGTYSATLPELPENAPGTWQVRFEADGANATGARFSRTGSGELVAERGAARLGEIRTEVAGDALRVRASVDVALPGAYRLDVLAADGSRNAVAWGEGVRNLTTGATELELDIPLAHLGAVRVDELFLDVRLLGLDTIGVAGRVTKEVD